MRQGASRGLQDAVSGLDFATHLADRHFLNVLSHFFLIFTNSLCFAVQSGPPCAKTPFFTVYYGARRNRQVALRVAKTLRILYFCMNFCGISRQRKNLFHSRSGSEIRHPKLPWGPLVMFVNRPPGTSFFTCHVFCCFDSSCAMLKPCWSSPGDLSEPSSSLPGTLVGASWRLLGLFLKLPCVLTTKLD